MENVDVSNQAQKQLDAPMSFNVSKVKDIKGLIIKGDEVLIKAVTNVSSGIIIVGDAGSTSVDELRIIKVGQFVKNYNPGDIVLDVINPRAIKYMHKGEGQEERYAVTNEYNINFATTADNIEA